jgi:hypothetical protein
MSRRSDAYDAGYDPTPEELAQDAAFEAGRSYRAPGARASRSAEPWADSLAVACGEFDPWADALGRSA